MKTNRLKVVAGDSPLAKRLGLRYLEVRCDGRLEACVWNHEQLSQEICKLAYQSKLDILKEGVSVLVAEQNLGLCAALDNVMSAIVTFELDSWRRKKPPRYQFKLEFKDESKVLYGRFSVPGFTTQTVSSLYQALELIDKATKEHDLDPDEGIRLLHAAGHSGLPLYSDGDPGFSQREPASPTGSASAVSINPAWSGFTLGPLKPN